MDTAGFGLRLGVRNHVGWGGEVTIAFVIFVRN